ncbi:two-component regulator propeller domain-containing protein [Candidatus Parabeggiatoa sp. HSG14]|uniref:two-component regulator propeller domain-containing protein n=1 Tax=Candidatus Parabeggiatoa sp. HSG14 TaxID=3055593 RepID=UPI0025A847ED|nr:two-component regulator propeller domain-containing protein [Thiotrichales bacterium HSG14]
MNMYFKIIILIILITLSLSGLAYTPKFKHFSLEQGLSQSTVYAILQDTKGFMWIGTQDGLNKYDGYQFTIYRHNLREPNSLSYNEVFAIFEDTMGTLWIGTGKGLNQYDRQQNKFIHYFHDPKNINSLSNNTIWSIYEDNKGMLWIGTQGGGLNRFDRQQKKFVRYQHDSNNSDSLSHNSVWPIYQDSTGILWIGTDGGGLNKFDHHKFKHYLPDAQNPANLNNIIMSIYEDSVGLLWIGTADGLYQFDSHKEKFVIRYQNDPKNPNSLSHNSIWAINEDDKGKLWIATDGGGINQFDRQTHKFLRYQHNPKNPDSLNDDAVLSLYQDRTKMWWVGTGSGGLNQFHFGQKKFEHYFHKSKNPNSLNNNYVLSIYEDKKGILWVGTQGGGLNKFDRKRQKVTHYLHDPQNPNSLSHNDVQSIYEDSTGILWVGTFGGGLNQFNLEQDKFVSYRHNNDNPDSLSNDHVLSIYEDHSKMLWIATREGLNKFDREQKKFIHYFHESKNPNSLSHNSIFPIYEDSTGTLWVGTQGGGLNKFDRQQQKFVHYQYDANNPFSLSHNEISVIYEDRANKLWIGTFGGGFNQFDRTTERFYAYQETDGLPNNMVYGILEDEQGYLWISSNKGLSKFDKNTKKFRNYDVSDGLQSNEFNAVYHKNRHRELFFGGINGFNTFYPTQIHDNAYIPPIVITKFEIFNKPVSIGGDSPLQQHISEIHEITLSYQQSFFSFEFAALNFIQSEKNVYAYQLEGFDKDWNYIGTRRNAYYTNVPDGTYLFHVQGSNNDKVWNEEGTVVKIVILPPLWKTWWAYTLYVIAILAIVLNYVRVQRKKLRKKQLELEREKQIATQLREADRLKDEFLANTSHELRTPINGIIGIADSLMDGAAGSLTQPLQTNLSMIAGSGRRLLNLVSDILDFSHLKKKEIDLQIKTVDVQTIVEVVLTLTQPLIGHKKVQLINSISTDLPPINADENRVQQILYNLIGNAIKFTDSGMIEISAEIKEKGSGVREKKLESILHSQLAITVSDTGIGIPEEKLDRIFEAFEQANGSTARIYGGTGLGLAVTQQLVKLHGGQMLVQSQLGMGSQFTFTLPISKEKIEQNKSPQLSSVINYQSPAINYLPLESNIQPSYSESELFQSNPLQGKFNILIVDDEPVNRQVLVNHLSLQNYIINQAASGDETLAYMEKGDKPDLILLDVMMPRMSGYEVTKKLRETWQADELPIILLTAKNQVADLVVGLESGANDYLTKPVSKDELLARIKTHFHILQLKAETLHLAVKNEKSLRQFLDAMPIGVGVLDAEGKPYYTNHKAEQILGKGVVKSDNNQQIFQVYKIYRAGTNQLYPLDELPIMQAKRGKSSCANDLEIHQSHKIISVETQGTPIFDDKGNVIYALSAFQDITERKQAEADKICLAQEREAKNSALQKNKEIEFKNKELAETLQQLQVTQRQLIEAEKMSALGNMVAGISHEVNTPIGIGRTMASLLDEKTADLMALYENGQMKRNNLDQYLKMVYQSNELILKNLTRAAELMKSFKEVAVDQSSEQKRRFLLKEYLHDILNSLQPEFKHTKHQVSIKCEKDILLISYPGAFSQIITNLVINSLIHGFSHFSKRKENLKIGQIIIEATTKNISSSMKIKEREENKAIINKGDLILRYSDNGKGISAKIINNIFEPFFTTNRQHGGTGLGLNIVFNLVTQKLNGTISCESIEGEGITFTIKIPQN